MKAVFDSKPGSGYDDEIQTRYHFPDRYLDEARKAVGDWIVYRAPAGAAVGSAILRRLTSPASILIPGFRDIPMPG